MMFRWIALEQTYLGKQTSPIHIKTTKYITERSI